MNATTMNKRSPDAGGTAARILDIAERFVQTRGFNGFSYADIAAEIQISKASLHYHFPAKSDLGEALVNRYAARFAEALNAIDKRGAAAPARLNAYARIYVDVLRDRRMCLCGMLAADYDTLPEPMRGAVIDFFDVNERWLAGVLEQGKNDGTLRFAETPGVVARAILGGLEGALLIARPYGDVERLEAAAARLLSEVVNTPPGA